MFLINKGLFFDQTKWHSTQKKRLFQMVYFKFHEKNYWESSKLIDSKINPSRENHAHFISCKPPHKNHPRVLWDYTLIHSNHNISCWRNLKFYQLHFTWALYARTMPSEVSKLSAILTHCSEDLVTPYFTWYMDSYWVESGLIYYNVNLQAAVTKNGLRCHVWNKIMPNWVLFNTQFGLPSKLTPK